MSKRTRRNARRAAQAPLERLGEGEYSYVVVHLDEGETCPICDACGGPPLAHSLVAGWELPKTAKGQPWQADPSNAVPSTGRSDDANDI